MSGRSLLDQLVDFATTRDITLPVFSSAALTLRKAIEQDVYDPAALEKAIDSDPALAAEVLRAANSAFFGGLSPATTIGAAILRLGLRKVGNLVLLASEKSRYAARDPRLAAWMTELWRHASCTALAADWYANKLKQPRLADEAFVGGLVHDIGELFLLRVLDQMLAENRDLRVAPGFIDEVLQTAHNEQGYRLMTAWNLPEIYRVIVRDHHRDDYNQNNLQLVIVRLADLTCNKVGIGLHPDPSVVLASTAEAHTLGVSEIALAEIEVILEDTKIAAAA
jgi:HD-like signal output (HDOD) protein